MTLAFQMFARLSLSDDDDDDDDADGKAHITAKQSHKTMNGIYGRMDHGITNRHKHLKCDVCVNIHTHRHTANVWHQNKIENAKTQT